MSKQVKKIEPDRYLGQGAPIFLSVIRSGTFTVEATVFRDEIYVRSYDYAHIDDIQELVDRAKKWKIENPNYFS